MELGDDDADASLTIGGLAARFDLAPHVLRHWETMGLLTPETRVNGRRRYGRAHLARVGLIVGGKQVGMSLSEIRDVLDAPDGGGRRVVLEGHLTALEQRIVEIQESMAAIEHILTCHYEDFTRCPDFQTQIEQVHFCERGDG